MPNPPTSSGLRALSLQKGLILHLALLGLAAGPVLGEPRNDLYESQAKLLFRYVTERPEKDSSKPTKGEAKAAERAMRTEMAILRSFDLAEQTVESVGVENVLLDLPKSEQSLLAAKKVLHDGLTVTSPIGSNVIHLAFRHRDQVVAQEVLKASIENYFKLHLQIHRPQGGGMDQVAQQVQKLRQRVENLEKELDDLKKSPSPAPTAVADLENQRSTAGKELDALTQTLEKALIDKSLDATRRPNLSVIQRPSVAFRVSESRP